MKRNAFVATAFGAVIALGLLSTGCSSSSNSGAGGTTGGQGGATGAGGTTGGGTGGKTGGTTGGTGGTGGKTGAGGATGGTDAGSDAPIACNPAPDDGTACTNNPPCSKNCGVNISALTLSRATKTCTCSTTWNCGSACTYPTDVDLTCLKLPTPVPACPHITVDGGDAGSGLIKANSTPCEVPGSEVCGNVCGSATAGTFSYQDSSGAGKVGYCACVSGTYQCASVAEWPVL